MKEQELILTTEKLERWKIENNAKIEDLMYLPVMCKNCGFKDLFFKFFKKEDKEDKFPPYFTPLPSKNPSWTTSTPITSTSITSSSSPIKFIHISTPILLECPKCQSSYIVALNMDLWISHMI